MRVEFIDGILLGKSKRDDGEMVAKIANAEENCIFSVIVRDVKTLERLNIGQHVTCICQVFIDFRIGFLEDYEEMHLPQKFTEPLHGLCGINTAYCC